MSIKSILGNEMNYRKNVLIKSKPFQLQHEREKKKYCFKGYCTHVLLTFALVFLFINMK